MSKTKLLGGECIICLKPKTKLSKEHVFPISIGGAWIIENVCEGCNNHIGKTIDQPFNRHKIISVFRNILNIRNDGRDIPNPFSGRHRVEGSEIEVNVSFKNGEPRAKILPSFLEPTQNDKGQLEGKIIMDSSFVNSETDWAKVYLKKMQLKGTGEILAQTIATSPISNFELRLIESNDSLLPEFAKIGYESVASLIPAYLNDPFAKVFQTFLRKGKMNASIKKLIDFRGIPEELIFEELSFAANLPRHLHFVQIIQKKGKGLFCLIKLFGFIHTIQVSEYDGYLLDPSISILNDATLRKEHIALPVRILDTTVSIIETSSTPFLNQDEPKYQFQKNENDEIPLFNQEGQKIISDIKRMQEVEGVASVFRLEYPNKVNHVFLSIPNVYIREVVSDTLFQVSKISFNCVAAYLNPAPILSS